MTTIKFETGATTHAVNDLILFTDHTRQLAEYRDKLYNDWTLTGDFGIKPLYERFIPLFEAARRYYIEEFKNKGAGHIIRMTREEIQEYCQLYVNDFKNWKLEHNK